MKPMSEAHCQWSNSRLTAGGRGMDIQGVPKKPQTIENNLLLEFQWPSTKLNPRVHKLLT